MIPFNNWRPLSISEIRQLFDTAPFAWGLAGGYAIEQFTGKSLRKHDDIDIVVFIDNQSIIQQWLAEWRLYAADPPGTLRTWNVQEYLPFGIHDIWCHKIESQVWQMQLMLAEVEGIEWFSRRNSNIRGERKDLFVDYRGISCIRVEVQLLYKASNIRPKDEFDFQACLPLMSKDSKEWLAHQLHLSFPQGHSWLGSLP